MKTIILENVLEEKDIAERMEKLMEKNSVVENIVKNKFGGYGVGILDKWPIASKSSLLSKLNIKEEYPTIYQDIK